MHCHNFTVVALSTNWPSKETLYLPSLFLRSTMGPSTAKRGLIIGIGLKPKLEGIQGSSHTYNPVPIR